MVQRKEGTYRKEPKGNKHKLNLLFEAFISEFKFRTNPGLS